MPDSDAMDLFDFKGFYKRLCLCKLENKKICEMSLEEVTSLLNAADCFLPKKCVYCKNYVADEGSNGRHGTCGHDNHKIADVFSFCTYDRDTVPFD